MVFIPGKSIVIWIFLERSRGKICSENCEREKERYFSFFFFFGYLVGQSLPLVVIIVANYFNNLSFIIENDYSKNKRINYNNYE